MKKVLTMMICFTFVFGIIFNVVNAVGTDPVLTNPGYDPNQVPDNMKQRLGSTWATIATIVQILAVGCVVFAGLRYMFASADQKADIKQGMIFLAIGATLVFGAISIVRLVTNVANEIAPR